jgi:hypothetical protein
MNGVDCSRIWGLTFPEFGLEKRWILLPSISSFEGDWSIYFTHFVETSDLTREIDLQMAIDIWPFAR